VLVTDVYAAGEPPVPGVSGRLVAEAATAAGATVTYTPHLGDVLTRLQELVRPGDLVVTTGAGDVTQVGPALLARLGGGA
jgi:UDP-N-acetylmuramate--alanine ligase